MKRILLIIIVFCVLQTGFAQRDFSFFNQMLSEADFIFEAKSLGYSCFCDKNKQIYTSNILEISKVFKGGLKIGTVEVLSEGGSYEERILTRDCNVSIPKGKRIIIFGVKVLKEHKINEFNLDNSITLDILYECYSTIEFGIETIESKYGTINPIASGCKTYFLSVSELYNSLPNRIDKNPYIEEYSNYEGATIEEREIFLRKIYNSVGANENEIDSMLNNPLLEKKIFKNIEHRKKKVNNEEPSNGSINKSNKKSNREINVLNNNDFKELFHKYEILQDERTHNIIYSIKNPKHSGSYFEFDVFVQGNDDTTYFTFGVVCIKYDTEIFGSNAYANAKVTRGKSLGWDYLAPFVLPVTDSTFAFNCTIDLDLPNARFRLTTTPMILCHVKMLALNCESDVDFTLNPLYMQGNSVYTYTYDSEKAGGFMYNVLTDNTILHMASCKAPTINSVSAFLNNNPMNLNTLVAGVGVKIVVSGSDFGTVKGQIKLRDVKLAENFQDSYKTIDTIDIISWCDTLIQFKLASSNSNNLIGVFDVGSGKIIIKKHINNQEKFSNETLNIIQSVKNVMNNTKTKKMRLILNSKNANEHIKFTLNNDIANNNNQKVEACIASALSQWRCCTGSWFSLTDTSSSKKVSEDDNINLVYFDRINSGALASTSCLSYEYKKCDTFAVITDIDIVIEKNENWFYDETCLIEVPADSFDFYSIVLHEFGHAHQVTHLSNINDLLYPYKDKQQRINIISLDDNAVVDSTLNYGIKTTNNCHIPKIYAMQKGANCTPILTFFDINKGENITNNAVITLNTTAIKIPISYAVNETGNFTTPKWLPYLSSVNYTLKGSGKHKLYFRVKSNREESNILTDSITFTPKESRLSDIQSEIIEDQSITIYPNPTSNIINIVHPSDVINACTIFNTLGTLLINKTLDNNETEVDLSCLPSGLYILVSKSKDKTFYTRIIKN